VYSVGWDLECVANALLRKFSHPFFSGKNFSKHHLNPHYHQSQIQFTLALLHQIHTHQHHSTLHPYWWSRLQESSSLQAHPRLHRLINFIQGIFVLITELCFLLSCLPLGLYPNSALLGFLTWFGTWSLTFFTRSLVALRFSTLIWYGDATSGYLS
jgi:hypothetical protein